MQNHLLPFISELEQLDKDTEVNQIIIDLYFDKKAGHAAVGKSETIEYIKKVKPNQTVKEEQKEVDLSVVIVLGEESLLCLMEKFLFPPSLIVIQSFHFPLS